MQNKKRSQYPLQTSHIITNSRVVLGTYSTQNRQHFDNRADKLQIHINYYYTWYGFDIVCNINGVCIQVQLMCDV